MPTATRPYKELDSPRSSRIFTTNTVDEKDSAKATRKTVPCVSPANSRPASIMSHSIKAPPTALTAM